MRYYPLFLDLTKARCLVVGAGPVGLRKLQGLLACPIKEVLILDRRAPGQNSAWMDVLFHPAVQFEQRDFFGTAERPIQPDDFADVVMGRTLVFTATNSPDINHAVATCCQERGVPCNVADDPGAGNFLVPAHVENGPLTVALSTGGASPALARALKQDLEKWLDRRYTCLIYLLEKLRPEIITLNLGSEANARVFRAIVALREPLADALNAGDHARCEALLRDVLPPAPFSLAELLHVSH